MGKSAVGAGEIWLVGNETTPGNVVITTSVSTGSGQGILYFNALKSVYRIRGLTLQASSGTNNGIAAAGGSLVYAQNIKFGTGLGDHLRVGSEAVITPEGNYEIAGSAVRHMNSGGSGLINLASGSLTITLTGTPAFLFKLVEASTCPARRSPDQQLGRGTS